MLWKYRKIVNFVALCRHFRLLGACVLGVSDIPQVERVCRHAGAGTTAVARLDDVLKLAHCEAVTPHLDQRAHDGAHHVAQESVGCDGEYPLLVVNACPPCMSDNAVIGLDVGVQLGERREVAVVE